MLAAAATGDAPKRILVINPNTNPAVTALAARACATFASETLHFEVAHPAQGPFSIENPSQRIEAEREVLALVRQRLMERHDAYVLACFDDLGLTALRHLVEGAPVVASCEAGMAEARALSPRFAIVTTVQAAVPGIRQLMSRYGAGDLATVYASGLGVAEAAAAGPGTLTRLTQTVKQAVESDGSQVVLLASGGLIGRAEALSLATGLPVVDAVVAAIARAAALVQGQGHPSSKKSAPASHHLV
jgi:allantoin racemase